MKTLLLAAAFLSNVVFAETCDIKLIPNMHVMLVLANYKTQWEVDGNGATNFDACKNAAEKKLAKANAPKKLDTFEEIMDDYWASWSQPSSFKGVKAKFTKSDGSVQQYVRYIK